MTPGAVQVNIDDTADLGSFTLVTARIGTQLIKIKVPEDGLVPGRQGWLKFPPERALIYAAGEAV